MVANVHFNPQHTAAHTADKSVVRLLLALTASLQLKIEHFDIKSAFVVQVRKPVYIRQHPRFDGSFKHDGKGRLLIKNPYGGPSGDYYYLTGAEEWLASIGFRQRFEDPCLFMRTTGPSSLIIIALTIDDFLIMATRTALIDWLYKSLNVKYHKKVKRLGRPTHYLGWKITFEAPGSAHLSQPHYIDEAFRMMRLEDANGRDTPHVEGYHYHGPDTDDITILQQKAKYQETLGELRYIADCTRPDIKFYVNRLSCAAHKPTKRHWAIMKNLQKYLKATREEGIRFYPFSAVPSLTAFIRDTKIPAHPLHSYADAGDKLD